MIRPAHKTDECRGRIEADVSAINPSDIFTPAQTFRVGRTVSICFYSFFKILYVPLRIFFFNADLRMRITAVFEY